MQLCRGQKNHLGVLYIRVSMYDMMSSIYKKGGILMRYMVIAQEEINTLDPERQSVVEHTIGETYCFCFLANEDDLEDKTDKAILEFEKSHPEQFKYAIKKPDESKDAG